LPHRLLSPVARQFALTALPVWYRLIKP
jgi:hypothetical protein